MLYELFEEKIAVPSVSDSYYSWDTDGVNIIFFLRMNNKKYKSKSGKTYKLQNKPSVLMMTASPESMPDAVQERYALMFPQKEWTLQQAQQWMNNNRQLYEEDRTDTVNPELFKDKGEQIELFESGLFDKKFSYNSDNGELSNIALMRLNSKNGYTYSKKAIEEALHLFEGVQMFIDHFYPDKKMPGKTRSLKDLVGKTTKVWLEEDDKGTILRGNAKIVKNHASNIQNLIEEFSDSFGCSPNVWAIKKNKKVSYIVGVKSIDFVAKPATTSNLYEEDNNNVLDKENGVKMDLANLKIENLKESRPDIVTELREDLSAKISLMQRKIDELSEEKRHREREVFISNSLQDAGIKHSDCSKIFLKQLQEAHTDLDVTQLIEDRKSVIDQYKTKAPQQPQLLKEENHKDKMSNDDLKKSIVKALKG